MRDYSAGTMKRSSTLNSRRMLLYGFLSILCFARTFESAPLDSGNDSATHESTGTLSDLPLKKGQDEEVGNPSELAWQAWLLMDGQSDSQAPDGLDSASLLRRIGNIRSIFVAPRLTDCAEGYQDDKMNRCVKDVNINPEAHMGYLLERLKAMYARKPEASASSSSSSSSSSASSSIPSGPLQLNIPLLMPAKSESQESEIQEVEKAPSTVEPLKIIAGDLAASNPNAGHQDAIVTVYELSDDQREDENTFFLGNKSTEIVDKNDESSQTRLDHVVPVAEFIEDSSSNLSGVVDYKISPKETFNRTSVKAEEMPNKIRDRENSKETEVSPTLVLLISPTKVPSIPLPGSDLVVAHNSSLGQVLIKTETVTGNVTAKEIIRVSVPDDVSLSPENIDPDEVVEESTTVHRSGDLDNGEYKDNIEDAEEPSTETYDDEAYEESTEIEDEILKHSEAGMTVTIPESVRPVTAETRAENDDKETTGSSKISSEVSINGDFVRETTLVDFNISKASNFTGTTSSKIAVTTTSSPITPKEIEVVETLLNPSITMTNDKRDGSQTSEAKNEETHSENHKKTDEVEEKVEKPPELVFPVSPIEALFEEEMKIEHSSTEKSESVETMIAASTNEAGQIISREPPKFDVASSSNSKKRGHPFRFDDTASSTTTKVPSTVPNVEGIYDYEPVPRDYPKRPGNGYPVDDSLPVIRTIDEQRYHSEREEDDQSFFNSQQQQQQDYVRFPSYDRHGRPNFVRFPSEEVNSIHNSNDYKDRNRRPYGQQYQAPNYGRATQTTKSLPEQEIRQKQSYWWVPHNWRNDRQQQQQQEPVNPQRSRSGSVDQRARDRAPMLLRFWTRMPLVRDPSLSFQQHPTHPTMVASSRSDSHVPSRRVNYYKEMSSRDLSRAFTRKSLPSTIGG